MILYKYRIRESFLAPVFYIIISSFYSFSLIWLFSKLSMMANDSTRMPV